MELDIGVIPVITILVYVLIEVFKIVNTNEKYLSFIPVISMILGVVIAIISTICSPEILGETDILTTMALGAVSGSASTGVNQSCKWFYNNWCKPSDSSNTTS